MCLYVFSHVPFFLKKSTIAHNFHLIRIRNVGFQCIFKEQFESNGFLWRFKFAFLLQAYIRFCLFIAFFFKKQEQCVHADPTKQVWVQRCRPQTSNSRSGFKLIFAFCCFWLLLFFKARTVRSRWPSKTSLSPTVPAPIFTCAFWLQAYIRFLCFWLLLFS